MGGRGRGGIEGGNVRQNAFSRSIASYTVTSGLFFNIHVHDLV